jgi:hypothetical protein
MEALQSWALCIVFSAVGALLVHALTPKGATEKAMRVMIALFLLSALLSPFLSGKGIKLTMPTQDSGDLDAQMKAAVEKVNRSLAQEARREIEEKARQALAEIGVSGAEIQVDMDIAEDSIISITELKIFLPDAQAGKERLIQGELEQRLGCSVTVELEER